MDWFLYNNGPRQERVKIFLFPTRENFFHVLKIFSLNDPVGSRKNLNHNSTNRSLALKSIHACEAICSLKLSSLINSFMAPYHKNTIGKSLFPYFISNRLFVVSFII